MNALDGQEALIPVAGGRFEQEFGVPLPGVDVRVVRRGSRIIVSCGGTRIGLSAEVARHVRVAPTA